MTHFSTSPCASFQLFLEIWPPQIRVLDERIAELLRAVPPPLPPTPHPQPFAVVAPRDAPAALDEARRRIRELEEQLRAAGEARDANASVARALQDEFKRHRAQHAKVGTVLLVGWWSGCPVRVNAGGVDQNESE